jgi:hypothetical protein
MGAADRLPTVCPVVSVVALGLLGDGWRQRATAPPGMIVVVEADCGLGEAYGRSLVGVPWDPADGPTRPAHPYPAGARHARGGPQCRLPLWCERLQPPNMTCKSIPLERGLCLGPPSVSGTRTMERGTRVVHLPSLPACFSHDSNICRKNVTEGAGRLRYSVSGEHMKANENSPPAGR